MARKQHTPEEIAHEEELQELYAQIDRLATQNEWLKKSGLLPFLI